MTDAAKDSKIRVSIVIPLLDESGNLRELYDRIVSTMDQLSTPYEIIFVDDGSEDESYQVLSGIRKEDPRTKVIKFLRNYGKSSALSAGFKAACGEVIVTMDADLQDVPEEIPRLIDRMEEGFDLVSGWRHKRADRLSKRLFSRLFNRLTRLFTGIRIHDFNCCLKVYRRTIIENLTVYGDMHRYIPVMASWKGFRIGEIKVKHARRKHGRTKYRWTNNLGGFLDLLTVIMLTRYTRKPIHLFGFLGTALVVIGMFINVYLTVRWFLGQWIGDKPLFLLGILMVIIGIQFVFFGLMAEMIAYSSKKQDEYIIDEVQG